MFPFANSLPTAGLHTLSKNVLFSYVLGIDHGHATNEPTNVPVVLQLGDFAQPQIAPTHGEADMHGTVAVASPAVMDDTVGSALVSSAPVGAGLPHGVEAVVLS